MKQISIFIATFLLMVSCSTVNKPINPTAPTSPDTPIVNDNQYLIAKDFSGFSPETREKLKGALVKTDSVIKSSCFEMEFTFKPLKEAHDKTPQQVLSELRGFSYEAVLTYYNNIFSKVIAYTKPSTDKIWLNWKYYKNYNICQMAANLGHEGTHKLGYDHNFTMIDTVPHRTGEAIRVCCE